MARFSGHIGFAQSIRTKGVTKENIVEKGPYKGSITRESRALAANGEKLNTDISTSNTIEVVADAYASENFIAIRYVVWAGTPWKVAEATVQRPRLLLRLGGVYNGDRPDNNGPETGTTPGSP